MELIGKILPQLDLASPEPMSHKTRLQKWNGESSKSFGKSTFFTFIFGDDNEIMLSAPARRESNSNTALKCAFIVCKFLDDTRELLSIHFPIFCEMLCSGKYNKMSYCRYFDLMVNQFSLPFSYNCAMIFWHIKKDKWTSMCM